MEDTGPMKAVLYGTYPTTERPRIEKFITTPWRLVTLFDDAPMEARTAALVDADALVTSHYSKIDPPAPKLKLLQCSSTGVERIDLTRLPAGCPVCNLFGHEAAIAEYVVWAVL